MALIDSSEELSFKEIFQIRYDAVVVIPVFNNYDDVIQCFESFFLHTPQHVPLLVIDDAGEDKRALDELVKSPHTTDRVVAIFRQSANQGFLGSCNKAFSLTQRNDVVLVNSDVRVTPNWFENLKDAAKSSNLVATATTLTNHGTIVSVPERNHPISRLPDFKSADQIALAVHFASARLFPTLPTAIGHCVWINRTALDVVGFFDPRFGRGYGEEVDFSQRAIQMGMKNVLADNTFVFHRGGGSFGAERKRLQEQNERIINKRYPWFADSVAIAANTVHSPLAVSLNRASIAIRGYSVAVDCRNLGKFLTGTQQVILETVKALSASPSVSKLTLYVNGKLPKYAVERLRSCEFEVKDAKDLPRKPQGRADVAYRPSQITSSNDVFFLRQIGNWTAINYLDAIAYQNASYFENRGEWMQFRRVTQLGFASIDGIAYLSEASKTESESEGLHQDGQSHKVIYNAASYEIEAQSQKPQFITALQGPFILMIGTSYHHKNRLFALQCLRKLDELGWDGSLLIAGPDPIHGNSIAYESSFFLQNPHVQEKFHALGGITDGEKKWLYENASLLIYPTLVEGFGLVPFEAAQEGLAALSTRQGSLDEVLPKDLEVMQSFDVDVVAEQILQLVTDDDRRRRIVDGLNNQAKLFTSEKTVEVLLDLFDEMTKRSPRNCQAILGEDRRVVSWLALKAPTRNYWLSLDDPPNNRIEVLARRYPAVRQILAPANSRRSAIVKKLVTRNPSS